MTFQMIVEADGWELHGPGGQVPLQAFEQRTPEGDDLDRVVLELGVRMDVEGEPKLVQLLYAHTHDSYDGAHIMVVEEGYVSRPAVAFVASRLGVTLDVAGFLRMLVEAGAPSGDAIDAVSAQLRTAAHDRTGGCDNL